MPMGFFKNLWGEACEVGGGHEDLLVAEDLAEEVGAALEVQFAEDVVEEEDGFFAGYAVHVGEFG